MIRVSGNLSKIALSRLNQEPGPAICGEARKIEATLVEFDFSRANHQALAHARLLASTTLIKEMYVQGPAYSYWAKANEYAVKAMTEERSIDGEMILDLHSILTSESGRKFREKTVHGGNTNYPETSDLPELWNIFISRLPETQNKSPILSAAEVYQWIVTLHFFEDANGRLARLCADYILLSSGLPPISFENDAAGFVSALAEPEYYSVDDAVERICKGLRHSTQILQS